MKEKATMETTGAALHRLGVWPTSKKQRVLVSKILAVQFSTHVFFNVGPPNVGHLFDHLLCELVH